MSEIMLVPAGFRKVGKGMSRILFPPRNGRNWIRTCSSCCLQALDCEWVRRALHVHVSGADEGEEKGASVSCYKPHVAWHCRAATGHGCLFLPSFFILQAGPWQWTRCNGETGKGQPVAPSWLLQDAATRGCREEEAGRGPTHFQTAMLASCCGSDDMVGWR